MKFLCIQYWYYLSPALWTCGSIINRIMSLSLALASGRTGGYWRMLSGEITCRRSCNYRYAVSSTGVRRWVDWTGHSRFRSFIMEWVVTFARRTRMAEWNNVVDCRYKFIELWKYGWQTILFAFLHSLRCNISSLYEYRFDKMTSCYNTP